MNTKDDESVLVPIGAVLTIAALAFLALGLKDSSGLPLKALLGVAGVSAGLAMVFAGSKALR